MTTPSLAYAAKLLCSFCGKDHEEVRKLIAGPTVFICDECVRLCQEILDQPIAHPAPVFTPAQEARIRELLSDCGSISHAIADRFAAGEAALTALIERSAK